MTFVSRVQLEQTLNTHCPPALVKDIAKHEVGAKGRGIIIVEREAGQAGYDRMKKQKVSYPASLYQIQWHKVVPSWLVD